MCGAAQRREQRVIRLAHALAGLGGVCVLRAERLELLLQRRNALCLIGGRLLRVGKLLLERVRLLLKAAVLVLKQLRVDGGVGQSAGIALLEVAQCSLGGVRLQDQREQHQQKCDRKNDRHIAQKGVALLRELLFRVRRSRSGSGLVFFAHIVFSFPPRRSRSSYSC